MAGLGGVRHSSVAIVSDVALTDLYSFVELINTSEEPDSDN